MARKNLYIRNFDKDVGEEDLHKFFSTFGTVKNVKIMVTDMGNGIKESKGFGFVCFDSAETATKVELLAKQNQIVLNSKQVFANFYETKGQRKSKFTKEMTSPQTFSTDPQLNLMGMQFMQLFNQFAKSNFPPGQAGGMNGAFQGGPRR